MAPALAVHIAEERSAVSPRHVLRRDVVAGLLVFFPAALVACGLYLLNERLRVPEEQAALAIGGGFAFMVVLPQLVYLLLRRTQIRATTSALLGLISVVSLLVSIFLYRASSIVAFPADILNWSEGEFVNDILKFRVGYPLYTDQRNGDSFIYTPGTQLLTYVIGLVLGSVDSIPLYRAIQVGYTLLASILAVASCRKLVQMSTHAQRLSGGMLWGALWLPVFFLVATNFLTNPHVLKLHNDALAQLVCALAFWLILEYTSSPNRRILAAMAVLPAAGFLVKQNLAIWALFFGAAILLDGAPGAVRRAALFTIAALFGVLTVVAICYLLWGDPFIFWVFTVLSKSGVSPMRSFQHVLDTWPYFVMGLVGGAVLLRGKRARVFAVPWLIWLGLILMEAYSSGIAWMLNHLGPGSLIASVWFFAGLAVLWPAIERSARRGPLWQGWLHCGIAAGVIGLLLSGLGVVRVPFTPLSEDALRYVRQIEDQFRGLPARDVLLDMGTWVYLGERVVMQDRASTFGDRGFNGTGDFSATLGRLREKRYAKILVRNLHSEHFWYDHASWARSSGIREALLANYSEIGRISGVVGRDSSTITYGLNEISILVPKPN